jgi:predicted enzyme related to lactoylglutathione lyase
MFFRGDQPIAGLVPTPDGSHPTWSVFLATPDLAGTVERAAAAGGRVLVEPMPVADLGSFAELADPAGAAVGAWQTDTFPGFLTRAEENAPAWFETLTTRYDDAVVRLPRSVRLGDPRRRRHRGVPLRRSASTRDRARRHHGRQRLPRRPASALAVLLQVADTDESVAKAVSIGAEVVAAEGTPYGRIATLIDPAGVQFCGVLGPNLA